MEVANVESVVSDTEYPDLADRLWRERELLEQVLFELAVEQLVVSSGQARWLPIANRRLDHALEQLRATEISRSMESDRLCERLGLALDTTLAGIAAIATEPWASIFTEHRDALLELTEEVRSTAEQNRRLLDAAARSVLDTLASITASIGTYDSRGARSDDFIRPSRLDEQA